MGENDLVHGGVLRFNWESKLSARLGIRNTELGARGRELENQKERNREERELLNGRARKTIDCVEGGRGGESEKR